MTESELIRALTLDRHHPMPLYYQLETQLEQLMQRGCLKANDRLPGDVPLSRALGINSRTVRQALGRLAARGLVRRRQRAGTFVKAQATTGRDRIGFFYFEENKRMRECAEAIQHYASRHDHDLEVVAFSKTFYEQIDLQAETSRMGLRGLVLVPLDTAGCKRNLQQIEADGIPYVRLGNAFFQGELRAPLIRSDWPNAIHQALHYLYALGHRHIGLICNTSIEAADLAPYEAFASVRNSFRERWRLVLPTDGALDTLYRLPVNDLLADYLDLNPELTAVCAMVLAEDLARIAFQKGRQVPNRLSIIGFGAGALPGARPLTTLRSNYRLMGEAAAHQLFGQIAHGIPDEAILVSMPLTLHMGSSTSAPLISPLSSGRPEQANVF